MGEVALRIKIGDREYPIKVQEESVSLIHKIAQDLNETIERHTKTLGLKDVQDALAMTAFDSLVKSHSVKQSNVMDAEIVNLVEALNKEISEVLS